MTISRSTTNGNTNQGFHILPAAASINPGGRAVQYPPPSIRYQGGDGQVPPPSIRCRGGDGQVPPPSTGHGGAESTRGLARKCPALWTLGPSFQSIQPGFHTNSTVISTGFQTRTRRGRWGGARLGFSATKSHGTTNTTTKDQPAAAGGLNPSGRALTRMTKDRRRGEWTTAGP